jgi:hypothetical protein
MVGAEVVKSFFEAQEKQKQLAEQLKIQQQLGQDTAKIEELQRLLKEQNTKVPSLSTTQPQP